LRRLAARATAIGIQFAASIVIGFGAGYWIDGKLGTKPWGSLVGLLLGAASAFRDLYLLGRKASKIT
jgi:ATP synthase protein I